VTTDANQPAGSGGGADSGSPEQGGRRSRVRKIDFRRPTKFPRDQVRRLHHAHEGFCRSASSRLSAELRTGLELVVTGSDQLPFAAAMAEAPQHALVAVLTVEPMRTQVALLIPMPLAQRLVDRLLGGEGALREGEPESMTELELAVARRGVQSMVEALSATWLDLAKAQFSIAGMVDSPVTVQIAPPSEPTLLMTINASIDDTTSTITFVMPHRSVSTVVDRLGHPEFGDADFDESASADVEEAVSGVEVELRAEVGAVELPVEELLRLEPGQIIGLGRSVGQGVLLRADDVTVCAGMPGRNGNRRAVQVRGGRNGAP
jgi:flagellar motor switch protein FliM